MSINTNIPVKSLTYNGAPLAFVAAAAGEDNTWMEEPVLTITVEEECAYLYIDSINGEPFEFEEMAGSYVVKGATDTTNGRLCFAPYKINASYYGFVLSASNSKSNTTQKGTFRIKQDGVNGWYVESNANQDSSWLTGCSAVYRHITHNQPASKAYRPFEGIESITKFTFIPYSGDIHAGTVINIYGKPVKKEV